MNEIRLMVPTFDGINHKEELISAKATDDDVVITLDEKKYYIPIEVFKGLIK